MDAVLLGSLVVLALVDSTSFGTLVIPIWLLLHPGPIRVGRMLVFLATVGGFYFVLGLTLVRGAVTVLPRLESWQDNAVVSWAQLVLGVALLMLSFRMGKGGRGGERLARWRERVWAGDRGAAAMVGLGVTAAAIEVTTMLPYLAAIGLVARAELSGPTTAVVMAGYCLVMVVPALLLMGLRIFVGGGVEPALNRISTWLTTSETAAWIVGIVGFLIARDAAVRLELLSWGS